MVFELNIKFIALACSYSATLEIQIVTVIALSPFVTSY